MIYILIDKISNINSASIFYTKSNLYFTERISIRWGDTSQINAEFILFESAYKYGGYSCYHLV